MINIESNGKNIIIRGRNPDGKRYEKIVKDFKPYFYVKNSNGEYTSLFGEKLRKVECDHPKEVRYLRNNFDKTYEADVLYIYKYMIDNYDSIESEPIRVCFIDIETEDRNGFPNVEKAEQPILSICAYDNFTNRFYMFEMNNLRSGDSKTKKEFEMPDGEKLELTVFSFDKEEDMLEKYIKFINDFDFDVFFAWNGDNFDYPYIINRMMKLGVDPINLSPLLRMSGFKPDCRIWLDLMNAYKKMSTHQLESMSLEYISQEELGVGKLKHDERVGEMWENNHEMFEKYNMIDVWLMIQIEKRKGVIGYFDTIRRFTFSKWYDVFYNTRTLDNLFLKCAKNRNIVLPTKIKIEDSGDIQGARVIDPLPGIHENIAVADVQSLYPTAALTCNMSPETIIDEQEAIENNIPYTSVDGVCFRLDKRGFIPQIIEELWDLRQSYKKEMRKYSIGSDEYNKWDTIQTVTKFLLNSVYGAMLAEHFRLFEQRVGKSITYFGRKSNYWMEDKIKEKGAYSVFGDTDSIGIKFKDHIDDIDEVIKRADEAITYVNNSMNEFCEKHFGSSKYNRMNVEFEKVYSKVLFVSGNDGEAVKKRYAGLIIWKDGTMLKEPMLEVKGFEAKRSDTPKFIRNLQKQIFIDILNGKNSEEIIKQIKDIRRAITNGEYSVEEIAIPKGMSKSVDEYNEKGMPIHVTGAKYYNKYLGGNITQEKVKYIYVSTPPIGLPDTHVISFIDKCPEGFIFNYEKMAELLIDNKFENILSSIDCSLNDIRGDGTQIKSTGWF